MAKKKLDYACVAASVPFLSGGEAATVPAGGGERDGMEWVLDGSVILGSLLCIPLFSCVGFSNVGFSCVGLSNVGFSNVGKSNASGVCGCS